MSTILVVDDNPHVRFMLRMVLEPDGHEVVEAVDGKAALDLIHPDPLPDVITTDLQMPLMSGLDLIERLQADPRTASIPIVVISSNPGAALALQASGLVKAVVEKPFSPSALADCIRAVLSRSQKGAGRSRASCA